MSDAFDKDTIARVVELLDSGETVCVGSVGGKWSRTLLRRSGQFFFDVFDEGLSHESPASQADFDAALVDASYAFHSLLARPMWHKFFETFLDQDRGAARAALDATRGLPGGFEANRYVFEAILDWPEEPPSAEVLAKLKQMAHGGTALHPFRSAAHGRTDPAAKKKGIEYLTILGEMSGWSRWLYQERADLHEQLGNLESALDDYLKARALEPRQALDEHIQKLRQAVRRSRKKPVQDS